MLSNKPKCSKIIGIQFSMLSPEEIENGSVAEITNRDTYVNNKPVIGGPFDPRMGVQEPGLICPTDSLDYMNTPGYHGHIKLAKPVYYIQHVNTICKCLRCVCFKCSKLLVNKNKHKHAMKMPADARFKYVFSKCGKIKRCGQNTEDGCNCLQPKIKKDGLATITAEWNTDKKKKSTAAVTADTESEEKTEIIIPITPEVALRILKRISDEDVTFMGFSPTFSRPEWMICRTLLVPPPAVRPSVKHDSQQRSEDDLSHLLINIIKHNKTLAEKIQKDADAATIRNWTEVLQYHVSAQINNKMPGAAPVAQRSGRPLKSIQERLTGKGGRMRGNLMAKRVDYSARSVITADPNISIDELRIPKKVAMNLTKPIKVNKINRAFLTKLVINGPDVWPGAKTLDKLNGDKITLKYLDRSNITLEIGDVVHRHMMDGDPVIFNRQPTLHKMSMMCHFARISDISDTFGMNVADTAPYNADFDGDEMNLHMPQDPESDAELRYLAAVKYQIISPAKNSSIIGIFQDSMLGSYLFSRDNVRFTPRQAMRLLAGFSKLNEHELLETIKNKKYVTNFDVLSQIMPPLSLKYRTKAYVDEEKTPNAVIEIKAGKYLRGQMDKSVMAAGTKGLLQRVCNDFGNAASANFIDNLQNIVTEYMKMSGFSVGISDLISNTKTNDEIVKVITQKKVDVKNLMDQVQMGVFENNTGKTNEEEFETQVNAILNQATSEAGKIGLNNLSDKNRFVTMVKAGSKGSDLNISFMIACLGQQNVDGKRIPYGFEHRTLPHFTKFDDSPGARGFVENSYINGLTPQELFMHAQGGRIGLIDTAVKTSKTGYIQRRIIKGLEDLIVKYDMTVRTNKNKIIQFKYGDDCIDPVKVETQEIGLVEMKSQDIYYHYILADDTPDNIFAQNVLTRMKKQKDEYNKLAQALVNEMMDYRTKIIKYIFKNKSDNKVNSPVAFHYIIGNIQGQCGINESSKVDITPLEALKMINDTFANLMMLYYSPPTDLFRALFYYYLSPKELLVIKRFNKDALSLLLTTITMCYQRSIVAPGETVGIIAGQSIGEVSTQMTLNTFHFAGVASKSNVTRGVPRIEEILALSSDIHNPSLSVYLKPDDETRKDRARNIMNMIEYIKLKEIVLSSEIWFDPDDLATIIEEDRECIAQYRAFETMVNECNGGDLAGAGASGAADEMPKSKWVVRLELNPEMMLEKNITMDDVNFTLRNAYEDTVSCVYSDFNSDKLIFRIRMNEPKQKKGKAQSLDQSDQINVVKDFQHAMLNDIILRGSKGINKVILRKIIDDVKEINGVYKKQDIWVLDTVGSNLLQVLGLNYIDNTRTFSNDIMEIYYTLGIEAARQAIFDELTEVVEFDGTYINYHNYSVLVDRMSYSYYLISMFRHGINNDDTGPIAKASFEETSEMFLRAARHAELDIMRGVSANVMCGQEGFFGTSAFKVILDLEKYQKMDAASEYKFVNIEDEIDKFFGGETAEEDPCGPNKIAVQNNVVTIKGKTLGEDNDAYDIGF